MDHDTLYDSTGYDPLRDALDAERLGRLRDLELGDAALRESHERERADREEARGRAEEELGEAGEVEAERVLGLRRHRADLDAEATAAQDVALRLLAGLGIPYTPGGTKPEALLQAPPLPRAEAARRAGLPSARPAADPLLKVLKYAGLAGCVLLGTFGMGALLLRVPPRELPGSPLLPLAAGLGCALVGGAYLAVVPAARRHGTISAARPNSEEARRSFASLAALVAGIGLTVALVDAKALAALDGARALVDPASVPPFGVTLLVAAALSATYVVGSAMLAFSEGFADETEAIVEAEAAKHAEGWREERRSDPDVRQAMEALGYAGTVDARRRELGGEIEGAEAGLKRAMREALAAAGGPPQEDEAARAERREREARARAAEVRLAAHERHRPSRAPRNGGSEGGGA